MRVYSLSPSLWDQFTNSVTGYGTEWGERTREKQNKTKYTHSLSSSPSLLPLSPSLWDQFTNSVTGYLVLLFFFDWLILNGNNREAWVCTCVCVWFFYLHQYRVDLQNERFRTGSNISCPFLVVVSNWDEPVRRELLREVLMPEQCTHTHTYTYTYTLISFF